MTDLLKIMTMKMKKQDVENVEKVRQFYAEQDEDLKDSSAIKRLLNDFTITCEKNPTFAKSCQTTFAHYRQMQENKPAVMNGKDLQNILPHYTTEQNDGIEGGFVVHTEALSYARDEQGKTHTENAQITYTRNHMIVLGSPGVGKTSSFVLSSLASIAMSKGNVFVTDSQNMLYQITHEMYEKQGYHVYRYNLDEPIDIDIKSLFASDTPFIIYFEYSKTNANKANTVFIEELLKEAVQCRDIYETSNRHNYILLDDYATLSPITNLSMYLSILRSTTHIAIIAQNLKQLGEEQQVLLANTDLLYFYCSDEETAEFVSQRIGFYAKQQSPTLVYTSDDLLQHKFHCDAILIGMRGVVAEVNLTSYYTC